MGAIQGEEELEPDFPPSLPSSPPSTVIAHLQFCLALFLFVFLIPKPSR